MWQRSDDIVMMLNELPNYSQPSPRTLQDRSRAENESVILKHCGQWRALTYFVTTIAHALTVSVQVCYSKSMIGRSMMGGTPFPIFCMPLCSISEFYRITCHSRQWSILRASVSTSSNHKQVNSALENNSNIQMSSNYWLQELKSRRTNMSRKLK